MDTIAGLEQIIREKRNAVTQIEREVEELYELLSAHQTGFDIGQKVRVRVPRYKTDFLGEVIGFERTGANGDMPHVEIIDLEVRDYSVFDPQYLTAVDP